MTHGIQVSADPAPAFAPSLLPVPARAHSIRCIHYYHAGRCLSAAVGQPVADGHREAGQLVVAILEAGAFLLCVHPGRGLLRHGPVVIGRDTVFQVDYD